MKNLMKIAHRGYSEIYPENTLSAFSAAVEAGADMIEFDVHLSRDGVPVVIHDDDIDRTSDGSGLVRDMSLDELNKYDYSKIRSGMPRENIPTLDETIGLLKGRAVMNIEIKNLPVKYPGIETAVAEALRRHSCMDSVIVSSFDHYSLLRMKHGMPGVRIGMLYEAAWLNFEEELNILNPYSIHPGIDSIDNDLLEKASARGIKIYTWVGRNRAAIERVCASGLIDGVMVNDLKLLD